MFNKMLFIVGFPRSGTKLIRKILNNNSSVSIPEVETHFIPHMLRLYKERKLYGINNYYSYFINTSFYQLYKKKGTNITITKIRENLLNNDIQSFIKLILQFYSPKYLSNRSFNYIWGDKTPLYLRKLNILQEFFPGCKFIVMIRDPRDIALSYKNTWGKSLIGTADKWRETMKMYESQKNDIHNIIEVKYENLLSTPKKTIQETCKFLSIDFENQMLSFSNNFEKYGSISKNRNIDKNNFKKYEKVLNEKQIIHIEKYANPILQNYYSNKLFKGENLKLSSFKKIIYKIYDNIKFIKHLAFRERGLKNGLTYYYKSLKRR